MKRKTKKRDEVSTVKSLWENLANLLKVKTMVTLSAISVFIILALRGVISGENVMMVTTTIIAFYFGTVSEKHHNDDDK